VEKLNSIALYCTTLSDAWFWAVYNILKEGRQFVINEGSYAGQKRLEYDYITIQISNPAAEPRLPQIPSQYNIPNPVDDNYMVDYVPYLMTGDKQPGEDYTYGERLCVVPYYKKLESKKLLLGGENHIGNQIEEIIKRYKEKGHRNNQLVLQIARPSDLWLTDPPCLRHIDTRIQDGKLHFYPYFRSWDLWGGFPANLAAIQILKEYMAGEIGVEDGEMIVSSKGLHLYDYVWELAECIRGKTLQEFKEEDL